MSSLPPAPFPTFTWNDPAVIAAAQQAEASARRANRFSADVTLVPYSLSTSPIPVEEFFNPPTFRAVAAAIEEARTRIFPLLPHPPVPAMPVAAPIAEARAPVVSLLSDLLSSELSPAAEPAPIPAVTGPLPPKQPVPKDQALPSSSAPQPPLTAAPSPTPVPASGLSVAATAQPPKRLVLITEKQHEEMMKKQEIPPVQRYGIFRSVLGTPSRARDSEALQNPPKPLGANEQKLLGEIKATIIWVDLSQIGPPERQAAKADFAPPKGRPTLSESKMNSADVAINKMMLVEKRFEVMEAMLATSNPEPLETECTFTQKNFLKIYLQIFFGMKASLCFLAKKKAEKFTNSILKKCLEKYALSELLQTTLHLFVSATTEEMDEELSFLLQQELSTLSLENLKQLDKPIQFLYFCLRDKPTLF